MIINLTAKARCTGQSVCLRVYLCDTMLQRACHKVLIRIALLCFWEHHLQKNPQLCTKNMKRLKSEKNRLLLCVMFSHHVCVCFLQLFLDILLRSSCHQCNITETTSICLSCFPENDVLLITPANCQGQFRDSGMTAEAASCVQLKHINGEVTWNSADIRHKDVIAHRAVTLSLCKQLLNVLFGSWGALLSLGE